LHKLTENVVKVIQLIQLRSFRSVTALRHVQRDRFLSRFLTDWDDISTFRLIDVAGFQLLYDHFVLYSITGICIYLFQQLLDY